MCCIMVVHDQYKSNMFMLTLVLEYQSLLSFPSSKLNLWLMHLLSKLMLHVPTSNPMVLIFQRNTLMFLVLVPYKINCVFSSL